MPSATDVAHRRPTTISESFEAAQAFQQGLETSPSDPSGASSQLHRAGDPLRGLVHPITILSRCLRGTGALLALRSSTPRAPSSRVAGVI